MKLQTKWRYPWEELFKKSMSVMLSLMIILVSLVSVVSAGNRMTVYNKSPWKVYLDSPDNAKPYYHLHFYHVNRPVYCLRLDNMQPCDKKNNNYVPKWLTEKVLKIPKVKSAYEHHNPQMKEPWFKSLVKPLLIAGAAIGVILATVNIFTGPIDDIAAWAALSYAVAN